MRTSVIKWWSLLAATALTVASCGGDTTGDGKGSTTAPPADTPPAVTFDGTAWTVTGGTIDGAALTPIAGRNSTLAVNAGTVSGSTGCNTYQATITVNPDGSLAITDFVVTEVGCEPVVMDFEADLLTILRGVDTFVWDGDRLTLRSGDGSIAVEMVATSDQPDGALPPSSWTLIGVTLGDRAGSIVAGTDVFLVLDPDAGAWHGNGGCNDYGAQVVYGDGTLTVTELVYTEMACDTAIMRQEATVFGVLARATTWRMEDESLVIATADGDELTFVARTESAEDTALAWIAALAAGDLDAAASLMAATSLAYVEDRGGLGAFATELSEGWGAWDGVADLQTRVVTGVFSDGTPATVVVLTGTIEQEGMTERRAAALLVVDGPGGFAVHPFTEAGGAEFVVPAGNDRVAPDTPFEMTLPADAAVIAFLDGDELTVTADPAVDGKFTAVAEPLPQPGEHVLTVVHLSPDGDVAARSVLFVIYP